MNPLQEKLLFGSSLLASAASSAVGAILTTGETRWLCVTFAVSFLMSGFLALMFKKSEDTIQLVIGRCGVAILGGIFGTYYVVDKFKIISVQTDVIALGGISGLVCILCFLIGYAFLRMVEDRAPAIASKLFKKYIP
jgi:hypothetical protein